MRFVSSKSSSSRSSFECFFATTTTSKNRRETNKKPFILWPTPTQNKVYVYQSKWTNYCLLNYNDTHSYIYTKFQHIIQVIKITSLLNTQCSS